MNANEVLDLLLLLRRLWPRGEMTREIAERFAEHFAKADFTRTKSAVVALADELRFPPTWGEIQKKTKALEADGRFRDKPRANVEEERRLKERREKAEEINYLREQGRLTVEEAEAFKARLDTLSLEEVWAVAYAGRHDEFTRLTRDYFGQRIPRAEYERRRQQLDAEIRAARGEADKGRGPRPNEPADAQ